MAVWLKIMAKQFRLKKTCIVAFILGCFLVTYLICARKPLWELPWHLHTFLAVTLQQSTALPITGRPTRFLFMALMVSSFFTTITFVCLITSDMISYFPDQTIRTADQIIDRNMSIYAFKYMKMALKSIPFENKEAIMKLVIETDEHPWLDDNLEHEVFIVGEDFYQVFAKSALHLNEFGKKRFYFLSPNIISYPHFYVFQRNAPYVGTFREFFYRVIEAGLHQHWTTLSMTNDKYPKWSYFKEQPFQPTAIPQANDQMVPAYEVFLVGLLLGFVVFLAELVHFNWRIWKAKL